MAVLKKERKKKSIKPRGSQINPKTISFAQFRSTGGEAAKVKLFFLPSFSELLRKKKTGQRDYKTKREPNKPQNHIVCTTWID